MKEITPDFNTPLSPGNGYFLIQSRNILISDQNKLSSNTLLGKSLEFVVKKGINGEINLRFEDLSHSFSDIEIEEIDSNHIKLVVTQEIRNMDGTIEFYDFMLEFGQSVINEEGELGVKIVCSDSNSTEFIVFGEKIINMNIVKKPVLSFRDFTKETEVKILIDFKGNYEVIYPKATEQKGNLLAWQATALPNNFVKVGGKKYPYLFWDGLTDYLKNEKFETGFCVASEDVIDFLEEKCELFGFDEQLTADFVTFWSPYLIKNKYTLIRWLTEKECQELARLDITSEEKIQIIRMYMIYKPVSQKVEIKQQNLEKVKLTAGAKIFDWGGFEVK